MEKVCNWCNPNTKGEYNASQFVNPGNTEQKLTVFFNGGETMIQLELPGQGKSILHTPINYCPMCGRPVRAEDKRV